MTPSLGAGIPGAAPSGPLVRTAGADANRRFWRVLLAIAAVYPNLWVNDGLVMSETLAALMVTLALLYAYRMARAPTPRRAFLLGLFCGLAAMARAELLLLVPLLAVPAALVARSVVPAVRWRSAGAAVVAAAIVVVPWVAY